MLNLRESFTSLLREVEISVSRKLFPLGQEKSSIIMSFFLHDFFFTIRIFEFGSTD